MMLVSDPILYPLDNECNIIYSSLFINDDGGRFYIYKYIYIYINMYICTIHLSYHACCFLSYMYIVWCIQLIIYCMVDPTRIVTTVSFQAITYLLVVVVTDMHVYIYIYIYIYISTIRLSCYHAIIFALS